MVSDAPEVLDHKGAKYIANDDGTFRCGVCGDVAKSGEGFKSPQAVQFHWNRWCEKNPGHQMAQVNQIEGLRKTRNDTQGVAIRSRRGRRRLDLDRAPDPMEEVPERPGGVRGGPAAYFIRPGATISEALIVAPNGAPMLSRSGKDRGNSRYYQDRLKDRGYEYIGPTLTAKGIRRLAEVIEAERPDYVIFLNEEIDLAQQTVRETENPEIRDQQRRRTGQLQRQLDIASKPFDAEHMIAELNDVLKAQKLAALSPAQREAIEIVMDEQVSQRVATLAQRFGSKGAATEEGFSVAITNAASDEDF